MTAATITAFPQRTDPDRNAYLVFIALVWVGVLSGFGIESFQHVSKHGLDYPLIVHFHAVVFVSFLVLFTTQAVLIRTGREDLHKRLGMAGAALVAVMLVLGPATAITSDAVDYAKHGVTPEFLAVQFIDMTFFGTMVGAALLLRHRPAAHKRLMLMALLYISNAGFSRYLNAIAAAPIKDPFWNDMVGIYLGGDVLMLGLGAYDLITRRRLHPAYLIALASAICLQLTARAGLYSPAWKAISMHLIGH
jgi:uncharacterized membrane protein YozB (DUF420 family)